MATEVAADLNEGISTRGVQVEVDMIDRRCFLLPVIHAEKNAKFRSVLRERDLSTAASVLKTVEKGIAIENVDTTTEVIVVTAGGLAIQTSKCTLPSAIRAERTVKCLSVLQETDRCTVATVLETPMPVVEAVAVGVRAGAIVLNHRHY